MFGCFRFFLAFVVVLSHMGYTILGGLPGISAVMVFYILAGYVVSGLWRRFFAPDRLWAFYAERFLRIYPLYFFLFFFSAIFVALTGFGDPVFTPFRVAANLTVIPLNFVNFSAWTGMVGDFPLLPTAWSLGAELQAYLLLPLLWRNTFVKATAAVLSLGVFTLATANVIDANLWGYRLLPGVLFAFMMGYALDLTLNAPVRADRFDRALPAAAWGWLFFLLVFLGLQGRFHTTFETFGVLLGLPMIITLARSRMRWPLDHWLGSLSYGIFLIHIPAIWLADYCGLGEAHRYIRINFVMAVSAMVTAIGIIFVERPVWRWRQIITNGSRHG